MITDYLFEVFNVIIGWSRLIEGIVNNGFTVTTFLDIFQAMVNA